MKSFLFLLGIILCSSLPLVSSSINNDIGSQDFLDEFPNDHFGWDTEAFFPPSDDIPTEETPADGTEGSQPEDGNNSLPPVEVDTGNNEEEAPVIPEEEYPIIPEEEYPVIPEEEYPVIPEEEYPVIPEEEYPTIPEEEYTIPPNEEDPIEQPDDPTDTDEFPEDPLRDNLLEFGVELVVEQARLDHNISKFNYTTTLTGSSDISDAYGVFYRISCNITHQNKSLVISANFNVYYQFSSGRRALSSFSYTLNTVEVPPTDPTGPTTPPVTPDYVEMTPAEIASDAEAQHILDFATTWIIEKGYNASKIPVSDYQVTQIVSFQRKVQANGINFYKGNINLEDDKHVKVNIQYTISIKSSTLSKFVYYWYYNVSNIRFLALSDEPIDIDGEFFDEEESLVGEYVD